MSSDEHGAVHFQTRQDNLGERARATGQARLDLAALGGASYSPLFSRAPEGQGLGPGEQMGAHFGSLVLALGLHR